MGLVDVVKDLGKKGKDLLNSGKEVVRKIDGLAKAHVPGYAAARDWTSRLFGGKLGDQAVPMPEVIAKVVAGNSGDWHSGAEKARRLSENHAQISQRITSISSDLEAVWSGRGSDAAQARIKPFANVASTAAQSFDGNSANLTGLAHGFDSVQSAFKAEPLPVRPDKGF